MKRLKHALFIFPLLVAAVVALAAAYYPVPSNIWATGDVVVAQNANNLTGVAAVASGQVLTSQGTATKPAWSASPSLTNLTLGASGTAITQMRVISATITPTMIDYTGNDRCEEQSFTLTGLTSADKVVVNPAFATNASAFMTTARASTGANTLLLTFCSVSAADATPAGGTINVLAVRS